MVKKIRFKMSKGLWKKGTVVILSLMLSFICSTALGMMPPPASRIFLFGGEGPTPPEPGPDPKPTKSINPLPSEGPLAINNLVNVNLNIPPFSQDEDKEPPEEGSEHPVDIVAVVQTNLISSNRQLLIRLADLAQAASIGRNSQSSIRLALVKYGCGTTQTFGFCNTDLMQDTGVVHNLDTDYEKFKTDVNNIIVTSYESRISNLGDGLLLAGGGLDYDARVMPNYGDSFSFPGIMKNFKNNEPDRYQKSKKVVFLFGPGTNNGNIEPTTDLVLDFYRNENITINTICNSGSSCDGYPPRINSLADMTQYVGRAPFTQTYCVVNPLGGPKEYAGGKDMGYQKQCLVAKFPGRTEKYCNYDFINESDVKGADLYCIVEGSRDTHRYCTDPITSFARRLNGLADETEGDYYYNLNSAGLNNILQPIFSIPNSPSSNINGSEGAAIEIKEYFDDNFSLVDESLSVKGPRGDLTRIDNIQDFMSPNTLRDRFFVYRTTNFLHILVSPGTVVLGDITNLVVNFNLKANRHSDQACIDNSGSEVRWGDFTWGEGSDPYNPATDKILNPILTKPLQPRYCYNIPSVVSANQGDVYFQTNPIFDLETSVAVVGESVARVTGNWATLKPYQFKTRTQSEKQRFENELIGIANYLASESPDNVVVVSSDSIDISGSNYRGKLIVARTQELGSSFTLKINGANSEPLGIMVIGGNAEFVNSDHLNGVLAVIPKNNAGGSIIINPNIIGGNSFAIKGSLVAKAIEAEIANLYLWQFNKSNYLNKIPGLALILDKIYSFYSF